MDCIPRSKFLSILICLFVSGSGCFSATQDKLAGQTARAAADVQDNESTASTLASPSADHVVPASQYNLLSWNVESDGATSEVICKQLAKLNQNDHYDILTLSEVLPSDLKKFRYALGKHYKYVYSKSGFSDRLEILYNENNFELVRHFEIKEINILNRYRAPLVAQLKDRATGTEFMVLSLIHI